MRRRRGDFQHRHAHSKKAPVRLRWEDSVLRLMRGSNAGGFIRERAPRFRSRGGVRPVSFIALFSNLEEITMNFEFIEDGHVYRVHTEVGNGTAKVVVEQEPAPEVALEPSEDA